MATQFESLTERHRKLSIDSRCSSWPTGPAVASMFYRRAWTRYASWDQIASCGSISPAAAT